MDTETLGLAGIAVVILTAMVKLLEQRARNPLRRQIEDLSKENDELVTEVERLRKLARQKRITHETLDDNID